MTADRITRARELLARAAATRSASWASRWTREAGDLLRRERLKDLSAGELRARAAVSTSRTAAKLERAAAELERKDKRRQAALKAAQTRREKAAAAALEAQRLEQKKAAKRERDRRYREKKKAEKLLRPFAVEGIIRADERATGIGAIVSGLLDTAKVRPWTLGPVVLRGSIQWTDPGDVFAERQTAADVLELARLTSDEARIVGQWLWELVYRARMAERGEDLANLLSDYKGAAAAGRAASQPARALNRAALSELLEAIDVEAQVTVERLALEPTA
jgi:hypothetical protein